MTQVLLSIPAGLGLAALGAGFLPRRLRGRALAGLCGLGVIWGVVFAVAGGSLSPWRGVAPDGGGALLVGAAAAASWVLVLVVERDAGAVVAAACVGVALSALGLVAFGEWVAPVAVFWVCGSVAVARLSTLLADRPVLWAGLFVSDALFVGSLALHVTQTDSWGLPTPAAGAAFWLAAAAAVVRGAAAGWLAGHARSRATAPAAVLAAAGAFALVQGVAGRTEPWVVVGACVAAAVAAVLAFRQRPWHNPAVVGLAVALGAGFAFPQAAGAAGAAGIFVLASATPHLLAHPAGRAVVALLPLSAMWPVIQGLMDGALERALGAATPAEAAPWSASLIVTVVALAGAVVGACRRSGHLAAGGTATLAAVTVAALSLLTGIALAPGAGELAWDLAPDRHAVAWLVAGLAGALAAGISWWRTRRAATAVGERDEPEGQPSVGVEALPAEARLSGVRRGVAAAAATVGVLAAAGVVVLVVRGLQLGFL